jgi:hypothetical protein
MPTTESQLTINSLAKARAIIDSIPKRKMQWKITPSIDRANGTVALEVEDWAGKITREVMNTKDVAVRKALIALGWTPPPETPCKH